MTHTCHAFGCGTPVKPELLMCARHWRVVPWPLKRAVWRHYRPGQCDDKRPSMEWFHAADAAIVAVADLEGKGGAAREHLAALENAGRGVADEFLAILQAQR